MDTREKLYSGSVSMGVEETRWSGCGRERERGVERDVCVLCSYDC